MTGRQATTGDWRFALVLGGGGLRGLAHVGALRALAARGMVPDEVYGTSIGALIAAGWASGFELDELEAIALGMQRRDLFVIAHGAMARRGLRAPALYRSEPLEHVVRGLVGEARFAELPRRLVVGAVEINSGQQIYFGLPGLEHVSVADAVVASCALPGFFPPRQIEGRFWVDGALVDNLPVRLAATRGHAAIVAVDVGSSSVLRADVQDQGLWAMSARASEIVFQQALEHHLQGWDSPPLLLVQPRVEHVPMFAVDRTRELIDEGYRATAAALDQALEALRQAGSGIFPRRSVMVRVLRERCIGCGACLAFGPPGMFRIESGTAVARAEAVEWSPADGGFLRHCPTFAITAHPAATASTADGSTGTAPVRS